MRRCSKRVSRELDHIFLLGGGGAGGDRALVSRRKIMREGSGIRYISYQFFFFFLYLFFLLNS